MASTPNTNKIAKIPGGTKQWEEDFVLTDNTQINPVFTIAIADGSVSIANNITIGGTITASEYVGVTAITALTGDVTASGSGSVAATVAHVGGQTAAAVAAAAVAIANATYTTTDNTVMTRDNTGSTNVFNLGFCGLYGQTIQLTSGVGSGYVLTSDSSGNGTWQAPATPPIATAANGLKSATTTVAVSSATAPTSGQVLTATGSTAATWQTPASVQACPSGMIAAFYLAWSGGSPTVPSGWVYCDGTNSTPDLRGMFIRGAGTNGTYTNANGAAYAATFGTEYNDQMQGHVHDTGFTSAASVGGSGDNFVIASSPGAASGVPVTDGTNGTPRTGAETRPANYALTYCMKS